MGSDADSTATVHLVKPVHILLRFVHRAYKLLISPLFGDCCRFTPYCSDYALQAMEQHGFWRGLFLAVKRVVRCHPYCRGGEDPVPGRSVPHAVNPRR